MRSKNTRAGNQLGQHHRRHHILSKWTKVKYFSWELFVSVFLMPAMQIVTSWFSLSIIKICNNTALIGDVRLSILTYRCLLSIGQGHVTQKWFVSRLADASAFQAPAKDWNTCTKSSHFSTSQFLKQGSLQSDITWLINSYKDSNLFFCILLLNVHGQD